MLKSKFSLVLVLIGLLVGACNSDDSLFIEKDDFLIFGHFYGECAGEGCIEIYKLTNTQLFEETNDNFLVTRPFNFVELDGDSFKGTKDLVDFFPDQLLEEDIEFIGCPDCADQGGIYIELMRNGKLSKWRIDQSKTEIPTYLHAFIDKVNEKISFINKYEN